MSNDAAAPVVVVGAGMAGLAAARRLQRAGRDVRVLEAGSRAGGVVESRAEEGWVFERGPHTVPGTAPTLGRLVDDAGLRSRLVGSRPEAARRLVWRHGRIRELPSGLPQLLTTDALPLRGRLRLLGEPLVPRRRSQQPERFDDFVRRRFGEAALHGLADPMAAGVFAGNVRELGTEAFPTLAGLEREHGSILLGAVQRMRRARRGSKSEGTDRASERTPALMSFPQGLAELPEALAERAGDALRTGHVVERLEASGEPSAPWRLHVRTSGDAPSTMEASGVVLAVPPTAASTLLAPLDAWVGETLGAIPCPDVAVVGLGYAASAFDEPLDAFGLLCASDSPPPTAGPVLGVLFASSIFPDRAPAGYVNLSVMLGGRRDPTVPGASDEVLVERARIAVRELLAARGEPERTLVSRWPGAIPQLRPGHARRIEEVRRRVRQLPPIRLAGAYLDGVGVEAAASSGDGAAEDLLAEL